MGRLLALAALCVAALGFAPGALAQARGVALVIGNATYAERPLANPLNDARDMAAALREAGFDVLLRTDVDETSMKLALAEFEDRLRAAGRGVGLFYFAGHGMQTSRGRNMLLPVGRAYQRERDAELFGVAADAVLASMERTGNALNIVVLDACRDAPLPADSRGGSRGLARMDAPSGSVIAFATAAGRTASDSPGRRNGLYTQHLLRSMRTPGLRLEDVFKDVGRAVERDSGGTQSPEEFMKLRDPTPFCFFGGATCGSRVAVQSAEEIEQEAWNAIRESRDARDLRDYLSRYPSGRFALLAQQRLRALETAPAPAPAPVTVATAPPTARPMEKVTLAGDAFFEPGQARLLAGGREMLGDLAARMRSFTLEVVIAVGHADTQETRDDASAQRLSVARAEAVKEHLVVLGVERNRVYTEGKGRKAPVADNKLPEGRAKNRRTEIEVVGTRPKS